MAFCVKCGSQVADGAAFCANCGNPQNVAPAAPVQAAPVAPAYAPPAAPVQAAPAAPTYAPPAAPVQAAPAAPAYAPPAAPVNRGQLHCPNCKGINLSPIVETSIDGALTTSRGGVSATRVNNTHRNYWMCGTCGYKFRNIQNLQEEIVKMEKSVVTAAIFAVIGAILCFIFCMLANDAGFLGFLYWSFIVFTGLFAIVSFCYIFVYKGRAGKMKQELAYLQQNCF